MPSFSEQRLLWKLIQNVPNYSKQTPAQVRQNGMDQNTIHQSVVGLNQANNPGIRVGNIQANDPNATGQEQSQQDVNAFNAATGNANHTGLIYGASDLVSRQQNQPLNDILTGIDEKYRKISESGQSIDPYTIQMEKQNAIHQYQAQLAIQQNYQHEQQNLAFQGGMTTQNPPQNQQQQATPASSAPAAASQAGGPPNPGFNPHPDLKAIADQRRQQRLAGMQGTTPPPSTGGNAPATPNASSAPPSSTPDATMNGAAPAGGAPTGGTPAPGGTAGGAQAGGASGGGPLDWLLQSLDPGIASTMQDYVAKSNAHILTLQAAIDQGKIDQTVGQYLIGQVKDQTIQNALDQKQQSLVFNAQQDALNRQAMENGKRDTQDTIERNQAQADLNSHIAYHNQQVQNTETEMQNRNAAAKLGINFDTGGLQWMQRQQQKGVDALDNIAQQMALNDTGFAKDSLKVIRDYTQGMAQAFQDATQNYNVAIKTYNDSVRNAKTDYASQSNTLRQFYSTQQQKLSEDVYNVDKDLGNTYKDLYDKMMQRQMQQATLSANMQYRQDVLDIRRDMVSMNQGKFDMNTYTRWDTIVGREKGRIQNDLTSNVYIKDYQEFNTKQSEVDAVMKSLEGGETLDPVKATALEDLFSRAFTTGSRVPVALVGMLEKNESPLQHFQGLINRYQGKGALPPQIANQIQTAVKASGDMLKSNAMKAAQTILLRINGVNRKIPPEYSDVGLQPEDFAVPGLTLPSIDLNGAQQYTPNSSSWGIPEAGHGAAPGGKLDDATIKKALSDAGFQGQALQTAYAIAMAESGGNPSAMGDTTIQDQTWGPSVGLMQIRSLKNASKDPYRDASKLQDLAYNAKAAYVKSRGGVDFSPWSTYTNGAYRHYLSPMS